VGAAAAGVTVWTIGHSTRTADECIAVLAAHEIEMVVDVRRFPGSRRLPQFGAEALSAALRAAGVGYRWIEALGGRRRPDPESPNDAWENEAFRGYADHTESEEFAEGLFELLMIAGGVRTAVMCAELLWWRCHRRIIADVLVALGYEVRHIRDAGVVELHELAPPARMVDGVLTYAAPVLQLDLYSPNHGFLV
jgi:uncharacterized protein (DUF488 family)